MGKGLILSAMNYLWDAIGVATPAVEWFGEIPVAVGSLTGEPPSSIGECTEKWAKVLCAEAVGCILPLCRKVKIEIFDVRSPAAGQFAAR